MNPELLLEQVKTQMTEHRFNHTIGVADTAVLLAQRYGADKEQAYLAGILHDYCKYWDKERMKEIMVEQNDTIPADLLEFDKELWHAPVGAYVVQRDLKIQDPMVLDAIRYHTSGRPGMSLLEKILWLADYIEPGRHFPGVDEVRELAVQDLNKAIAKAMGNTIIFLVKQRKRIYPLTLETYNDIVYQLNQEGKES
ncbi:bis(5'-nucleosyl)-tetraphosphatase (symmetrical) YqeK [Ammoniphilus sp. CFH 90114]|uniref:bis(5'-nucleosyl)-tetraphosphatase (symmetrical) YqeK n=1 Tax=Ammoniphilus sp. CFH 90114 TaxID=2493665 RepID=UPI00100E9B52|nr:bis(5'-nucleosyl)-tetraphosphatase (symmetrical) YqeK [Ammoniphilus sp. CFH 90114]RXT14790.1 HD domain-containing protein [Ammoniphilus sp. CFH 90114]